MPFQRRSLQREVILEELRSLTSHPTAEELHEIVRRRLPRVSLGTVYRNLELMTRHGLVRKLESGGGQARFDGNLARHLHVRCAQCGRVADVQDAPEDPWHTDVDRLSDFEILGLRVEYVGICPQCAEQLSAENRVQLQREWS